MKFKKLFISISIPAIVIFTPLSSFTYNSSYIWSNEQTVETSTNTNKETKENNDTLNLESGSAILIEQSTGQVLYAHNEHEKLRPASVTKVMSILLIMEQIDSGKLNYEDKISCSQNASSMGGSQIWLDTNEQLTVDEMLKAICVVSANDCVVAMAEHIAGSEESFVQMMNDKAKELGMKDTTFKNCHGIDEDGHETSAYDIALMSKELLQNHPNITKYTTIWMDTLRDGKSELVNTNKLIRSYKGITGLKTGSTSLALYNLSASATRDNLSLIAVIMKAPSTKVRFAEASKLLNYGFSKFAFQKFGNKGDVVKTIQVDKSTVSNLDVILADDAGALVQKGSESSLNQSIELDEVLSESVNKGDKIGQVTFSIDNKVVSQVDLVAARDIRKNNMFINLRNVVYKWIDLLR